MRMRLPLRVLSACICGLGVSRSEAADWPQWRCDAGRTAHTPDALPGRLHLQWVRELPAPRPAWPKGQDKLRFDASYEPVVAGGLLLVPSMVADSVTAYDASTGEERWRFYADGPVRFAPVVHKGLVWFVSDDGRLYCLRARDGSLVRKIRGGPADNRIIGNDRLVGMWPARGAPVLFQDDRGATIYFAAGIWPFMGIFIHAVDAETGGTVWTNSGSGSIYIPQQHNSPAFAGVAPQGYLAATDDDLLVSGGRTVPAAYDRRTGKFLYFHVASRQFGKDAGGYRVVADGEFFYNGGAKYSLADGKGVGTSDERFDPTAAGRSLAAGGSWQARVQGNVWSMLAADGRLFVVTREGRIYCFGEHPGGKETHYILRRRELRPASGPWAAKAEDILRDSGAGEGYCVALGIGSSGLVEALVARSKLHVIVIDPDARKVDAFRRRMDDCGLYGTRVAAIVGRVASGSSSEATRRGDPFDCGMPPYLASLVVSENLRLSEDAGRQVMEAVFRMLRPYGGAAYLPDSNSRDVASWARGARNRNARFSRAAGCAKLAREGALPDSAPWTHQYADAANSVVSRDRLVKAPLGLLWFGGPPNDPVLPRHGHGPSPQVAGGRLFIQGQHMLRAVDVYTGRLLWEKELPEIGWYYRHTRHHPGANEIGSNYVSLADGVYVMSPRSCLRLDPATGKTVKEYRLPATGGGRARWGFILAGEDLLIAAASPVAVSGDGEAPAAAPRASAALSEADYSSASATLVVMARESGRVLWTRRAAYSFRHNAIVAGGGKIYCIDGVSAPKMDALRRRGVTPRAKPMVYALDARTGRVVWKNDENVFGTWLGYSTEHDVLLEAGSRSRDRAEDEVGKGMAAYRGADGKVLWRSDEGYAGPCMLHHGTVITQGWALGLLDGKRKTREHPLTGEEITWGFTRNYGCNTAVASEHLILFRSAAAGYYDLARDGGTGNFGGFKSGCTSNLIAADGVLSAPDYTRTCTCSYQNQSSLALVHMPEVETWTFNKLKWSGAPVKRVGINLGAPGDRLAENGTLWMDYPSVGGPSPNIPVRTSPDKPQWFRKHSSLIRGPQGRGPGRTGRPGDDLRWVAASGARGLDSLTIDLGRGAARRYNVRLVFSEPDGLGPGERVFDVALQGRTVLMGLDVAQRAGAADTVLVTEFAGVRVTRDLEITLRPSGAGARPGRSGPLKARTTRPPILCGVEAAATAPNEDAQD